MTWQEVYKLPLRIEEYAPFMVVTSDNKRAFDFLFDNFDNFYEKIIETINGTPHKFDHKFYYNNYGEILYDGNQIITIRGWGYLTGVGGLNLSDEEACKIQDEFGKYIIDKLNGKPN